MSERAKAIVRVHGQADPEKIHRALTAFIKKVEQKKKEGK